MAASVAKKKNGSDEPKPEQQADPIIHATETAPITRPLAVVEKPIDPLVMVREAIERGINPEQLDKFLDFVRKVQEDRGRATFAEAIAGFQSECPQITKERIVYGKARENGYKPEMYRFASYDDIKAITRPIEAKHGISTSFDFTHDRPENGGAMLHGICRVRVGSYHEDHNFSIPIPKGMNTNAAQDYGQALSYLKRYLYCAALDIVVTDEDRDGEALASKITEEQVDQIGSLMRECAKFGPPTAVEEERFVRWLGAATIEEIHPDKFDQAVKELNRRIAQAKKGGGK